jgi:hypothetical protein
LDGSLLVKGSTYSSIVDKAVLDNGYLLIELSWHTWDGTNWVNNGRYTRLYVPITGITQLSATIQNYSLSNNFPNPFNPSTAIKFDLPKTSEVSLKIFNILGEEVATLVSEKLSTGSYSYEWDAVNLPSGLYLYRLEVEEFVETKKMILMK